MAPPPPSTEDSWLSLASVFPWCWWSLSTYSSISNAHCEAHRAASEHAEAGCTFNDIDIMI